MNTAAADLRESTGNDPGHRSIAVINPATEETVAQVPEATSQEIDNAVRIAKAAMPAWAGLPHAARQDLCRQIAQKIADNAEDLAEILTIEQGKPLNGLGSRWEIGAAQAWCEYTSSLDLPIAERSDDGLVEILREPIGVVAAITPWNFPVLIAIWHIVPALLTGNTVVIKPSPNTPLATGKLVSLLSEVLPAGVLTAVNGGSNVGSRLTAHPLIAKVTFTGSTRAGKHIIGTSAGTVKRLTLELGGNDAAIVLPDVDVDAIIEDLFWGAFLNNGQTCAAIKRLYVHEEVHDRVCAGLADYASRIKTGNGLAEDVVLGPLQNANQLNTVQRLLDQAVQSGAQVLSEGNDLPRQGFFSPVAIVIDIANDAALVQQEQFGPALPVLKYSDLAQAIAWANDTPFGLGGSVWSQDTALARRVAGQLECGTVWINKHGAIRPDAPFGGVKQSGVGVQFGADGLCEYLTFKSIIG